MEPLSTKLKKKKTLANVFSFSRAMGRQIEKNPLLVTIFIGQVLCIGGWTSVE